MFGIGRPVGGLHLKTEIEFFATLTLFDGRITKSLLRSRSKKINKRQNYQKIIVCLTPWKQSTFGQPMIIAFAFQLGGEVSIIRN